MKTVIGYVGTKDFNLLKEEDVKALSIINIAFGHVKNGDVVWESQEAPKYMKWAKEINPELKICLSVGGWSAGGFSTAASTKEGRERFAKTAVDILKQYDLDGIDIDWEYPCISIAGIDASPDDKVNFTLLLEALRNELDKVENKKCLLMVATGGDEYFLRCTEMDKASKYLDIVQIMTYDLRGGFSKQTGHHTNLYTSPTDLNSVSAHNTISKFIEAGVPREKIIMGVAFYSRMWTGVPNVDNGHMQMADSTGGYGPGYGELVKEYINKNGYTRYWDDDAKAPYLFNGNTFISYDDEDSIKAKADYVKENGLCGLMYWEYCLDDTFTLTTYLRKVLS